jgi:hypothetical protein
MVANNIQEPWKLFTYVLMQNVVSSLSEIFYTNQMFRNIYLNTRPVGPLPLTFTESVKEISKSYCDIYEEAHKAEEFGLTQVCGVGYRKALEFLLKTT